MLAYGKPGGILISNRNLKKTKGEGRTHTTPASEKYKAVLALWDSLNKGFCE